MFHIVAKRPKLIQWPKLWDVWNTLSYRRDLRCRRLPREFPLSADVIYVSPHRSTQRNLAPVPDEFNPGRRSFETPRRASPFPVWANGSAIGIGNEGRRRPDTGRVSTSARVRTRGVRSNATVLRILKAEFHPNPLQSTKTIPTSNLAKCWLHYSWKQEEIPSIVPAAFLC